MQVRGSGGAAAASAGPVNPLRGLRQFLGRNIIQEQLWGLLLMLPYLINLLLFTAGPIIAAFLISFTNYDLIRRPEWLGFENYTLGATDKQTIAAFKNTGYYVLWYVPSSMIISLLLAIGLNERIRGITFYRTLFFLPVVASGVATALLWRFIFNKRGVLNWVLDLFGLDAVQWLGFEMALNSIIIMSVWQGLGILMMYWLAGLQGVPQHLYEAAEIDGGGRWAKFRHVTVPMLTPFVLLLMILGVIGSFQVFTASYIITGGGPGYATLTLALQIYRMGFENFRMGYAAALAYMMFLAVFIVTMIQWWAQKYWVHYE
ncbi:MAG: sugar ABC transporter permease [Chloroflexi bacterium]|nr:sugar ABC transporter permease [Chloroflexota bacterium]MCY3937291.1 sugar ABC transporter permease [Chloroflexota bacterium]